MPPIMYNLTFKSHKLPPLLVTLSNISLLPIYFLFSQYANSQSYNLIPWHVKMIVWV